MLFLFNLHERKPYSHTRTHVHTHTHIHEYKHVHTDIHVHSHEHPIPEPAQYTNDTRAHRHTSIHWHGEHSYVAPFSFRDIVQLKNPRRTQARAIIEHRSEERTRGKKSPSGSPFSLSFLQGRTEGKREREEEASKQIIRKRKEERKSWYKKKNIYIHRRGSEFSPGDEGVVIIFASENTHCVSGYRRGTRSPWPYRTSFRFPASLHGTDFFHPGDRSLITIVSNVD